MGFHTYYESPYICGPFVTGWSQGNLFSLVKGRRL